MGTCAVYESVGFIPVRYANLPKDADADFLLAKMTDWLPQDEDNWYGTGQRMLITDAAEFSLLNIRDIVFDHTASDAPVDDDQALKAGIGDRPE